MKYKVTLRDKTYEVEVEAGQAMIVDEYAAFAPAAPAPAAAPAAPAAAPAVAPAPAAAPVATAAGETITSPMPGSILDVKVNVGDSVKAGQILIILEAMKMENEIVAAHDGVVKQIVTSKGATVDTGAPLVVIG